MGTGYGAVCVRCKVNQMRYEEGYDHERVLCDECMKDLNKQQYDEAN